MDAEARAAAIHADLPVVDGHNDWPWRLRTEPQGRFHTDVDRLVAGGVGAQFWSVYVPTDFASPHRETLAQIDLVGRIVSADDRLVLAAGHRDLERLRGSGKVASLLGAEGGHSIEGDLGKLRGLRDRGVRYMTITHADTNDLADSATDDAVHGGLSALGRRVVAEMNRIGMIVDISHVSAETMRDALSSSTAPMIASHSNARAVADHPRNIPDDVLVEIGRRGGVAMVAFVPAFLVQETAESLRSMFDEWRRVRAEHPGDEQAIAAELAALDAAADLPRGTVADVADHIEHIAAVAGVDAVGLGSDFDGTTSTPAGLEDVSCYPAITSELLRRGWSEGDVRKVLGENARRVLRDVEAAAG